jgi:hypothetical protein
MMRVAQPAGGPQQVLVEAALAVPSVLNKKINTDRRLEVTPHVRWAPELMKRRQMNPRSLANLRPWQPGQSGNPRGRPKMPRDLTYAAATALAAQEGCHPLQILLRNMSDLHRAAQLARTPERQLALLSKAAGAAAKALPFCMPRMGTIELPPE